MIKTLAAVLFVFCLASPAHAGTFGVDGDGKLTWQSSTCTKPTPPPSLLDANIESGAEDMNQLSIQYNAYVATVQAYFNCLNKEAEADATAAGQAVLGSEQGVVTGMQKDLDKMRASVAAAAK